ncbi:FRG domain-containing protein [Bifidobacterium pseudocatenulatum]|uniref:FRG domain-containing protein n=2 Tax=Bifidobacterium pseudocatenulatum TaxID=28026 RepID=UPI0022E61A0F|nr:FRG domain-containing protein [Bifidobacterium pseudocatenulatum]
MKHALAERNEAIRNGIDVPEMDYVLEQSLMMRTEGTVIQMPYGLHIITFPSKGHLFRGEIQNYHKSIPSLNRMLKDGMSNKEKELIRVIAHLRKRQFGRLIWKINVVPYWEAEISDINFDALAQHYGLATHLMDLTNDFKAALFFATCKYVPETDSYRPLTQGVDKSEDAQFGYIFHTPDWTIDFLNGGGTEWSFKHLYNTDPVNAACAERRFFLQSGDVDGLAFQIGYQPLQRCDHQSAYVYPMRNGRSLQSNWRFEKMRFRQSVEISQQVYQMMDEGKKIFPNEGVTELHDYIERIKHSVTFSMDELHEVYEDDGVKKALFPTFDTLKTALIGYATSDGMISIQNKPIEYDVPQKLLDTVNSHYDGKICWKRSVV